MKSIDDKKLDILYDHYKDTCSCVQENNKYRERLFIYVLIIVFVQLLQISLASDFVDMSNDFINKQIGIKSTFSKEFVDGFLWFLLFSFSLRYFQNNVFINRQYKYLHRLEKRIARVSGDGKLITREGKGYLNKYPAFSNWTHFVYTWLFPILLIAVAISRCAFNIFIGHQNGLSVHFAGLFLLMTLTSTILYMVTIHRE